MADETKTVDETRAMQIAEIRALIEEGIASGPPMSLDELRAKLRAAHTEHTKSKDDAAA